MHSTEKVKSIFIPGSEWLYFKLYCGVYVSDEILLSKIKPIAEILIKENKITHWFFIRYADPENHLRIRFHLSEDKYFSNLVGLVSKSLKEEVESKIIWKITIDSYDRETDRYGYNTIEDVELFFHYDSSQILNILANFSDGQSRFLQLLNWLEFIISKFRINEEELIAFLDQNQQNFKKEFRINHKGKKELGFKYKKLIKNNNNQYNLAFLREQEVSNTIKILINKMRKDEKIYNLPRILSSLIHMSTNRLFSHNQRLYEMVVYDFLYKKCKTNFIRYGRI